MSYARGTDLVGVFTQTTKERINVHKTPNVLGGILVITLIVLSAVVVPASAEKEKNPGDKVAAVNGAIITYQEFNWEVSRVQQQFSSRGRVLNQAQLSELKKGILENLINWALLFQESQKKNIDVEILKIVENP